MRVLWVEAPLLLRWPVASTWRLSRCGRAHRECVTGVGVEIAPGVSMPLLGFGTWQAPGASADDAVAHGARGRLPAHRHRDHVPQRGRGRPGASPRAASRATRSSSPRSCRRTAPGGERETIEESLRELGLDHVDLWLIHWPPAAARGPTSGSGSLELQARRAGARGRREQLQPRADRRARAGDRPACRRSTRSSGARRCTTRGSLDAHRRRGVQLEGYSPLKTTRPPRPGASPRSPSAHGVTPGAGRAPLAPRARDRRDPEVDEPRAHRRERRRLRTSRWSRTRSRHSTTSVLAPSAIDSLTGIEGSDLTR